MLCIQTPLFLKGVFFQKNYLAINLYFKNYFFCHTYSIALNSTEMETGRNDRGIGLALIGKGDGSYVSSPVTQSGFYTAGNVKCMEKIMIGGKPAYLVGKNGDRLKLIQRDLNNL